MGTCDIGCLHAQQPGAHPLRISRARFETSVLSRERWLARRRQYAHADAPVVYVNATASAVYWFHIALLPPSQGIATARPVRRAESCSPPLTVYIHPSSNHLAGNTPSSRTAVCYAPGRSERRFSSPALAPFLLSELYTELICHRNDNAGA
jgi:hypothetical protein